MSDLTDTIKETSKIVTEKYKKKIENIVEGIKATPSYFKKKKSKQKIW